MLRKLFWGFILCIAIPADFLVWNSLFKRRGYGKITIKNCFDDNYRVYLKKIKR